MAITNATMSTAGNPTLVSGTIQDFLSCIGTVTYMRTGNNDYFNFKENGDKVISSIKFYTTLSSDTREVGYTSGSYQTTWVPRNEEGYYEFPSTINRSPGTNISFRRGSSPYGEPFPVTETIWRVVVEYKDGTIEEAYAEPTPAGIKNIFLGGNNVSSIFLGAETVDKIYLGAELVYGAGGSPAPSSGVHVVLSVGNGSMTPSDPSNFLAGIGTLSVAYNNSSASFRIQEASTKTLNKIQLYTDSTYSTRQVWWYSPGSSAYNSTNVSKTSNAYYEVSFTHGHGSTVNFGQVGRETISRLVCYYTDGTVEDTAAVS